MNKSLNAIDVEMSHCVDKTPEANKKKPKQLTLFEMSSGGKFALKCDQEKELQKSADKNKSSKNNKSLLNKSKSQDENTENNENRPNGKQKKSTKSKLDNLLKPKDLNSDIEIIENDDTKSKEPEKKPGSPPKEEQKCVVLVEKLNIDTNKKQTTNILDFFAKSQENQMKKVKSDTSSTSSSAASAPKEITIATRVELSDKFLEEIGSYVTLRNLKLDEETKEEEDDDHLKKNSFYFGDLAMIIELNNLISKIYPEKKTVKKRGRKSVENKNEFTISNMRLENLVDFLNKPNSFNMLIKTYLRILLKEDDLFKGVKLFELELNEIDIHDCMLNELCKLLATLNLVGRENSTEMNLLIEDENLMAKSDPLRALGANRSSDSFVNLNLIQRIELVKLLLHLILTGRKYDIYYEQMHNKLVNYEAKLKQGEIEFVEKLGIEYNVYKSNKKKYLQEAAESKKLKIFAEKLKQTKLNIERARSAFKACNRLVSIGNDSKGNSYWSFSFIKKLIVEKKTSDENKSEWFTFTQAQAKNLVDHLKSCREEASFLKLLKESIETIYEGAGEDEEEGEMKANDIISCESTHEDEEETQDIKAKLAQFERPATRSLRSNANNTSQTEDDDVIFEKEEEKKSARTDKMVYENQQEWLACFAECHSIEDLLLLIVNQQIFFDQHGCLKLNSLKSLTSKLGDYDSMKSFDEKLEYLKQIMCEMFDSLWHLLFSSKALTSGKLKQWKSCVESSSSLSNLYLMSYIYFKIIKWEALYDKTICKDCNKKGDKFAKTLNLKELADYDCETGFYLCMTCKSNVHKKCALKDGKLEDKFTNGGLYNCASCDEKKKNFYYATEVVGEQKKDDQADTDEEHDENSHKLRKRKQVIDYNEKKTYLQRSVSNSSVSSQASSTRSSIESSSGATTANSSTRSGRRTKRNDNEPAESRSTRSSARLATTTQNIKPKYVDEDSDYDD